MLRRSDLLHRVAAQHQQLLARDERLRTDGKFLSPLIHPICGKTFHTTVGKQIKILTPAQDLVCRRHVAAVLHVQIFIQQHGGAHLPVFQQQRGVCAILRNADKAAAAKVKRENKANFANYLQKATGQVIDPDSIFDCQVKRMHEYKRQHLNALNIAAEYLYLKNNPNAEFTPKTYIFGAKAAPGYYMAKQMIRMICKLGKLIDEDPAVRGKLRIVYLEDYCVSLSERLMPVSEVSEQISLAGTEASGTGNMKFMLNGALTLGTMDGANVEIVEEVGKENAFIFGLSADEVINYEKNGGYNPEEIFNTDQDIRRVLMQLINGYYSPQDPELFRDIYNSLLNTKNSAKADTYFILKDFRSYAEAQKRVEAAYRDETWWARAAMLNTASAGKFSSDRTIEEYVRDIWHLEKIHVDDDDVKAL